MSFGGERREQGLLATCDQQVDHGAACAAVAWAGRVFLVWLRTSREISYSDQRKEHNRNGLVFRQSSRSDNGGGPLVLHHLFCTYPFPGDSRAKGLTLPRAAGAHPERAVERDLEAVEFSVAWAWGLGRSAGYPALGAKQMAIEATVVGNVLTAPEQRFVVTVTGQKKVTAFRVMSDVYTGEGDSRAQDDAKSSPVGITIWQEHLGEDVFQKIRPGMRVEVSGSLYLHNWEPTDEEYEAGKMPVHEMRITANSVALRLNRVTNIQMQPKRDAQASAPATPARGNRQTAMADDDIPY